MHDLGIVNLLGIALDESRDSRQQVYDWPIEWVDAAQKDWGIGEIPVWEGIPKTEARDKIVHYAKQTSPDDELFADAVSVRQSPLERSKTNRSRTQYACGFLGPVRTTLPSPGRAGPKRLLGFSSVTYRQYAPSSRLAYGPGRAPPDSVRVIRIGPYLFHPAYHQGQLTMTPRPRKYSFSSCIPITLKWNTEAASSTPAPAATAS